LKAAVLRTPAAWGQGHANPIPRSVIAIRFLFVLFVQQQLHEPGVDKQLLPADLLLGKSAVLDLMHCLSTVFVSSSTAGGRRGRSL